MGFSIKPLENGSTVRHIRFFPGKDRKTGEGCFFKLGFSLFEILLENEDEVVRLRCSFRGGVQYPKFTLVWPERLERPMVDIGRDRGMGRGRKVVDQLAEPVWVSGGREEYDKHDIEKRLDQLGVDSSLVLGLFLGQLAEFA